MSATPRDYWGEFLEKHPDEDEFFEETYLGKGGADEEDLYWPLELLRDIAIPEATIIIDVDSDGCAILMIYNHETWWVYWKEYTELDDFRWESREDFNEWAQGVVDTIKSRENPKLLVHITTDNHVPSVESLILDTPANRKAVIEWLTKTTKWQHPTVAPESNTIYFNQKEEGIADFMTEVSVEVADLSQHVDLSQRIKEEAE